MLTKKILTPVMASALIFSACSKDEDGGGNCSLSGAALEGTYIVTSEIIDGVETIDDYEPCQRDDTYSFDGSNIIFIDAGVECPGSMPAATPYTLNGDQFTIVYSASDKDVYTVTNFTCDSFELVVEDDVVHFERL